MAKTKKESDEFKDWWARNEKNWRVIAEDSNDDLEHNGNAGELAG